jgi:hypothetical protein
MAPATNDGRFTVAVVIFSIGEKRVTDKLLVHRAARARAGEIAGKR